MQLHEQVGALRRETELDASRDAVWSLVAEPEGLASWLADEVELAAVEPGERGVVVDAGERRQVTIEEVREGRRLVLSWRAAEGEPSLVELTLDDLEDGRTRMIVVEIPLVALRVAAERSVVALRDRVMRGPQMAALVA